MNNLPEMKYSNQTAITFTKQGVSMTCENCKDSAKAKPRSDKSNMSIFIEEDGSVGIRIEGFEFQWCGNKKRTISDLIRAVSNWACEEHEKKEGPIFVDEFFVKSDEEN